MHGKLGFWPNKLQKAKPRLQMDLHCLAVNKDAN